VRPSPCPFSLLHPHHQILGKGTQCSLLVEKYNFSHLSTGDLLRAEKDRPDSQFGDLIRTHIHEGKLVPLEVTIKLLENAMDAVLESKSGEGWGDGKGRFLVDGFPRKMDQALKFEEDVRLTHPRARTDTSRFTDGCAISQVCTSSLVLFFTTDEETMLKRLLERGKTSGRDDDNIESIKNRFGESRSSPVNAALLYSSVLREVTYKETTMPVIEHYEKFGKVAQVRSKSLWLSVLPIHPTRRGRSIALQRWIRSTLRPSPSWLRSSLRSQL
jgi:UMP-CMP kinase